MKTPQAPLPTFQPGRHLQVLDERVHDPYQDQEQLAEPAVCAGCGAAWLQGAWQWTTPSAYAMQARCPACRRIDDGRPAARVTIEGGFAQQYRDELLSQARDLEADQKAAHPLRRIMAIEEGEALHIDTTDTQLARDIGEAFVRSYKGTLEVDYDDTRQRTHVRWHA